MKIFQVLNRFSDKKILNKLVEKYPDQSTSLDGYLGVLDQLRSLEPVESDQIIRCKKFGCHIVKKNDELTYAFGPIDWAEVLGSEPNYGSLDFICNLLWELTYYGFTKKENADFWDEIKDSVKGLD